MIALCSFQVWAGTIGGSGGHGIQEDGADLTARPKLNCAGNLLTCTDNPGQNRTDITADLAQVAPANIYVAGQTGAGELEGINPGTVWQGCKLNDCLAFDGVNDYVTIPDNAVFEPANDVSWSVWVYIALEADGAILAKQGTSGYTNQAYMILNSCSANTTDWKCGIAFIGNSAGVIVSSTVSIPLYTWTLVQITIDETAGASNDVLSIYVNNVLDTQTSGLTWVMDAASTTLDLGRQTATTTFGGMRLDDVRMYSKVLSSGDRATIYNSGAGSNCATDGVTSMIVCFKLDDLSTLSATTLDTTSTYTGTLTGFAASQIPSAISGAVFCKFSRCLHLDGTNDFLWVRDAGDMSYASGDTLVFEAWFMNEDSATVSATRTLASKGVRSTGNTNFTIDLNSGTDEIRFAYGGSACTSIADTWTSTNFNMTQGVIRGIAINYTFGTGSTFQMWAISNAGTATAVTGAWATNGNVAPCATTMPMTIGSAGSSVVTSSVSPWKGRFDDVQMWRGNYTSHDTAGEIQTDMNTACTSAGTGKEECWNLNETFGSLASNVSAQTGAGSDSATCLSTSVPCLTINGAISKIPSRFYGGTTTIHVASGTYPETVVAEGFYPAGAFNIIFDFVIDPVANHFASACTSTLCDVAQKSGTVTATSANGFPGGSADPPNARSTLTDSGAAFGAEDAEALLHITGPASTQGYCSDSTYGIYDPRNWYRIEKHADSAGTTSTTNLSVVTKWNGGQDVLTYKNCGIPVTGVTYKVYHEWAMATIHGGDILARGLVVDKSVAVRVRKARIVHTYERAFDSESSIVDELSSSSITNNNVDRGGGFGFGADFNSSQPRLVMANNFSHNFYLGLHIASQSHAGYIKRNIFGDNDVSAVGLGFGMFYQSSADGFVENLCQNHAQGVGCVDIELQSSIFGMIYNRFQNNLVDVTCVSSSTCAFLANNVFTDEGNAIAVDYSFNVAANADILFEPTGDPFSGTYTDMVSKNKTVGVRVEDGGMCRSCERFSYYTVTQQAFVTQGLKIDESRHGWNIYQDDEFLSGLTTSGNIGNLGWLSSTSATTIVNGVQDHPGIRKIATTTASGNIAVIYLESVTGTSVSSQYYDSTFIFRVGVSDPDATIRIGYTDNATAAPANGFYFECLNTDTNWFGVMDATTKYRVDTGSSCLRDATSWQRLRMYRDAGTGTYNYRFIVTVPGTTPKSILLQSSDAGCGGNCSPAVSLTPNFQITNTDATTAKTIDIDYFDLTIGGITR